MPLEGVDQEAAGERRPAEVGLGCQGVELLNHQRLNGNAQPALTALGSFVDDQLLKRGHGPGMGGPIRLWSTFSAAPLQWPAAAGPVGSVDLGYADTEAPAVAVVSFDAVGGVQNGHGSVVSGLGPAGSPPGWPTNLKGSEHLRPDQRR